MDRSQQVSYALDELRQIRSEARNSQSLTQLRAYFDRLQEIRHTHLHDFDVQLLLSEVQEEVIERARAVRATPYGKEPEPHPYITASEPHEEHPEAAEIPPEVPRVDQHTWRRSVLLALFLTGVALAAFFYLIQTARRINLPPPAAQTANPAATKQVSNTPAGQTASTVPVRPTLRLYTDLAPATLSIDGGAPQELADGELILDQLAPGQHSATVTGRNGSASFSFKIDGDAAPIVTAPPVAINVLAVLVSEQGGKGRVVTNAQNSALVLDGNAAGDIGSDGLTIDNLGTADHNLEIHREKDRQQFVWTYTPAPVLTVYVKSDPNAGTLVLVTHLDGVNVFINDKPYRRQTEHGELRIPLKVNEYIIRVHKDGFADPPPQIVDIKKSEESAVDFTLAPAPEFATLQVKGAAAGTGIYIDKQLAATVGPAGTAAITDVKPGEHAVELQRDGAIAKNSSQVFQAGKTVVLSGDDVTLEPVHIEATAPPPPPPADSSPAPAAASADFEMNTEQVKKGGGFVAYHIPRTAGHYSFQVHSHIGGILKHGKLQWYAGYLDSENYVLFTLDGKHAIVHDIRDGKSEEVNRIAFNADSNEWVQVNLSVKPDSIGAQIRTATGSWNDLGSVTGNGGRDFTQGKVGFYIPGNDEMAIANFRFSAR